MKKNNILYFVILSLLFSKNIDANENNKKNPSINCIDENLNPCSSVEISKDKSDKKIIVNNASHRKKNKINQKRNVKKESKKVVKKNKKIKTSKDDEKVITKTLNKNEKKRKLMKKKQKKNKKKEISLLTSNESNINFNFNKEMSFNEYKELLLNYSTSSEYPNIDN